MDARAVYYLAAGIAPQIMFLVFQQAFYSWYIKSLSQDIRAILFLLLLSLTSALLSLNTRLDIIQNDNKENDNENHSVNRKSNRDSMPRISLGQFLPAGLAYSASMLLTQESIRYLPLQTRLLAGLAGSLVAVRYFKYVRTGCRYTLGEAASLLLVALGVNVLRRVGFESGSSSGEVEERELYGLSLVFLAALSEGMYLSSLDRLLERETFTASEVMANVNICASFVFATTVLVAYFFGHSLVHMSILDDVTLPSSSRYISGLDSPVPLLWDRFLLGSGPGRSVWDGHGPLFVMLIPVVLLLSSIGQSYSHSLVERFKDSQLMMDVSALAGLASFLLTASVLGHPYTSGQCVGVLLILLGFAVDFSDRFCTQH